MQERPINNNSNPENEINIPTQLMNGKEQPSLVLVNRNHNANEVLINMQWHQILRGQNGPNRGLGLEAIQNPRISQMIE